MTDAFLPALRACPLVAILRGIEPDQVEAIGEVLVDAGFTLIEVPLNSPRPLASIERLARRLEGRALVGAGTVLNIGQVTDVANAGGQLIVSPNTDTAVIEASVAAGLASLPGCFTPSEAFAAAHAGAHAFKFFPAEGLAPQVVKAMFAVLPPAIPRLAVGGISPTNMLPWLQVGIDGFGLGSALYAAGDDIARTRQTSTAFVQAIASHREAVPLRKTLQ